MQKLSIFVLFISLITIGCARIENNHESGNAEIGDISLQSNENIYWVNSLKYDCVGVGPMQCLQIQKGKELKPNDWTLFYSSINGFEYEQGYVYKIVVKEEAIPSEHVPTNGASIKYSLIKVLEKHQDDTLRLNDIWALETISGKSLDLNNSQQRPVLEINLREMQILGNDGCNNFNGGIDRLTADNIMFSRITSTMMACFDMDISSKFHQNINNVQAYSLKDLKLYLFDSLGNELFVFKKID